MNLKALGSAKKDTRVVYYLPVREDNEKALSLLIKIIPTERVNVSK